MTIGAGTIGATPVGGVQRRGEARTATVSVTDADTLNTTGARARTATATATDTDTLGVVTTRPRNATLTLIDADTLTAVGTTSVFSARLRDTDTVASAGTHTRTGASDGSDTDALTVTASRPRAATVTSTDTDTLTATGARARVATATATDTDTLTATASRPRSVTAKLVDTEAFTVSALRPRAATATSTDTDTLAGVGSVSRAGTAALVDTDTFTSMGARSRTATTTPVDTDTLATTATVIIYQNEVRWLLSIIESAWPGDIPNTVTLFNRDNATAGSSDRKRAAVNLEQSAAVMVSSESVDRDPIGTKPIDDVETTLTVTVQAKSTRDRGTIGDAAEFKTLVAQVQHAINTELVLPVVTQDAQPLGRVIYEDLRIESVEYQSSTHKDAYRADLSVVLRGKQPLP